MLIAQNPVIPGFHPDPSICRVGSEFYLVNSSFEYAPGVPIFRSSDLRRWSPVGHVLDRPDQLDIVGCRHSGGVYAPTLRYHQGRFWMITTNVSDGPGQLLVTASDPAGPWSRPIRVPDAHGIDPDLAWDDAGTCWLSWSGELPPGRQGILQAALNTETGALLTEPAVIWRGTGGQFPEGPHLVQRGSSWYLFIAEGGTERGHAVTVARAPRPNGPFEPCPDNPLLTARGTDWPTQNTGHADVVQRPDGSWAMVFLGVRPRGSTPAWHVLGRETFAAELDWEDGWPRLGRPIEGSATGPVVEHLTGPVPPHSWVAPSHHRADLLTFAPEGHWRLTAPSREEAFVGRRQEHFFISARAEVDPGAGRAGLEVRIDPFHRLTLSIEDGRVRASTRIGDLRVVLGEMAVAAPPVLELRTQPSEGAVGTPHQGPDLIVVGVRGATGFRELGRLDGRYLSTEVAGGFTGRMIGLVGEGPGAVVKSFVYRGCDDPTRLND
ncbi:glycoside hydrolase family 43 protein [Actinomadura fibrosa]|uniref:Family 43 glycosylhydrolase n=1 Tax=Actinomadura fibrosa TaxID=111802 RepID=A0ABW2XNY6_9ACTN|nr:glycoside hydrolase family 43 protein [Actinomadura fibrosa]